MVCLFLQPGKTIPEEKKRGLKKQHEMLIKPWGISILQYFLNLGLVCAKIQARIWGQ